MARLRINADYEQSLRKNGRAGDIFALKNLDGWTDQQTIEHKGTVQQALVVLPAQQSIEQWEQAEDQKTIKIDEVVE